MIKKFSYTGNNETFTFPPNINYITVYCWGAGGGSSKATNNGLVGGYGGNGGFVSAKINVSSIPSITIVVGQGGKKGVQRSESGTAFGGGGSGKSADNNWAVGGGGGYSGVFFKDEPLVIAGGGGGAGVDNFFQGAILNGGNGGGLVGNAGSGRKGMGLGGTQSAGGTSGTANVATPNKRGGSKYKGGDAESYAAGGGGGWYGGGAGHYTLPSNDDVASGGGGSSYVSSDTNLIINNNIPKAQVNGTRIVTNNTYKYYENGAGLGADKGLNNGNNGLIIIEYSEFTSYSGDVTEEIRIDYELNKYPSRFPDTINDINDKTQTFTINNSEYKVTFSSYNLDYKTATPLYLFDGNTNNADKNENIGGNFGDKDENKYNQTSGTYKGVNSFEGISGEWVSIKFPYSFILKKFGFIAKANYEVNAPGKWVLFAKNTSSIYQIIDDTRSEETLTIDKYFNVNTYFNKLKPLNDIVSDTYVFVFTGLTNTTKNSSRDNNLNFIEILLFGKPN
jgi:hypothetical protein